MDPLFSVLNPWSAQALDKVVFTKDSQNEVEVVIANSGVEGAPLMIFLKGFYPGVGLYGYKDLIHFTAAQGIDVLAPISPKDTFGESMTTQMGLSTCDFAKNMYAALKPLIGNRSVVIYGHSLGAWVALHFANLMLEDDIDIHAMMLDGVPPSDGKIKDETPPTIQEEYGFPIYFVQFEKDSLCSKSTAELCRLLEDQGTLIQVKSFHHQEQLYPANHFSPFTNDPQDKVSTSDRELWDAKKRPLLRSISDKVASSDDMHGYEVTIGMTYVDYYGSMTLLPALGMLLSNQAQTVHKAQSLLTSDFSYADQLLRNVQ